MYKTSRQYPTFLIPGVAAIVIQDNKVLLVKRRNEPSKGKWRLPGGVVNIGETINEAIIREVLKETSIKIKPIKLFKVLDSITKDDKNKISLYSIGISM